MDFYSYSEFLWYQRARGRFAQRPKAADYLVTAAAVLSIVGFSMIFTRMLVWTFPPKSSRSRLAF
jgi:hypothetical protein